MSTPADPPKSSRILRRVFVLMFATMAVIGVVGLFVWWKNDPYFTLRPEMKEARQLSDTARVRPLTDDEFDRTVKLFDSYTPAAELVAIAVLQLEAERTPERKDRAVAALERCEQSGSPQGRQASAAVLGRMQGNSPTRWEVLPVGTDAKFRGLSVVSADVVWASGTGGTVVRSIDGSKTWGVFAVPGAADLDFRDVEAFGPDVAYVLSAGDGDKSRIYKTTDAGQSWQLKYTNPDAAGFFDALAFWDEKNGLALGDPIGGKFQLIHTTDGKTWQSLTCDMPAALADEGAFAASGTCLITHGENGAWFVTGGPNGGRVFHSVDRGKTWAVQVSPLTAGSKSAGVFGIAFRDELNGVIVGGDYTKPDDVGANAAVTTDGGKSWRLTDPLPFRSCAAWANGRWVVVGTSGVDATADGKAWQLLDGGKYNSVAFKGGVGWAVGPDGRMAKWK